MTSHAHTLSWRQRIRGHISGPVGSILFHILVIFLMVRYIVTPEKKPEDRGGIVIVTTITPPLPPLEPPPPPPDVVPPMSPDVPFSPWTGDTQHEDPGHSRTVENDPAPVIEPNPGPSISLPPPPGGEGGSITGLPPKVKIIRELPPPSRDAVLRALLWLRDNQNPDGSWHSTHKTANTGLALLAFLARGEDPTSAEFGRTVEAAMQYLMGNLDAKGRFQTVPGHSYAYEHAIATYALADAYRRTLIPQVRDKLELAVEVMVKGQRTAGGWDYGYAVDSARVDASVTAWQVQALKAASVSGARNKGLEEALTRALNGIRTLQDPKSGHFGYATDNRRTNPGLTAIGVLTLQFGFEHKSREAEQGMAALRGVRATADISPWPFYAWYYVTQSKFIQKGLIWDSWNKDLTPRLVKGQNMDGSWHSPSSGEKSQGPAYSTALGALTLQAYSKFLSTSSEGALARPAPSKMEESGEIEIIL